MKIIYIKTVFGRLNVHLVYTVIRCRNSYIKHATSYHYSTHTFYSQKNVHTEKVSFTKQLPKVRSPSYNNIKKKNRIFLKFQNNKLQLFLLILN